MLKIQNKIGEKFMKKILIGVLSFLMLAACDSQEEVKDVNPELQGVVVDSADKVSGIDNLVLKVAKYQPGVHYKVLEKPIDAKDNEIIEYFWFKCPHCYKFEKMLKDNYIMLKDNRVTVRIEHAAISKRWVQDAQLFYTFKVMGIERKALPVLMEFYHNNKDKEGNPKKTFDDVLAELGVTKEKLDEVFISQKVIDLLKQSHSDAVQAGISGTPSIIVEGKYLMNNKSFKGYKELLEAAIELTKIDDKK